MDSQALVKRFQTVKSKRSNIQEIWDTIEELVTPYRGRFFKDNTTEDSIEWRKRKAWDSTAVMAHQNLSASLHGSLTSPSTKWFDILFRDLKLNKDKQASQWLRDGADAVYYELQDSNFNLEINETYQDVVGFGTSMLSQEMNEVETEQDWNGMVFSGVPLKEGYFEEDWAGGARYFYRLFKWTAGQIVSKFGEDKVPDAIKRKEVAGDTDRIKVLFVIYPTGKIAPPWGKLLSVEQRPFNYKYILHDTVEDLGDVGGYYEMPVFIPRWRKTSESMWGNSPAMFALSDILVLNEWVELMTVRAAKDIDPPILAEEKAIITDLYLDAQSVSIVRNVEGIKELTTGGKMSITFEGLRDLRASVRNYFFTDQINYPDPQAQPMTATEAQIRYELMQRLLGPTLGRLQSDLLNPIVSRTFNMLLRAGIIPAPPEVVIANGGALDIEYMGTLARAQRVDQAAAVERWIGSLGAIAEFMPSVLDVPNDEEIARGLGRQLNVDPAMINDAKEVKKKRADRQQKASRAEDATLAAAEGQAAQDVGKGQQAIQDAEGGAAA